MTATYPALCVPAASHQALIRHLYFLNLSHIHPDPWEQKPGEQEGVSNCHYCLAKPPDTGNLTLNKKESLARIFQQLQGKRQCSVQIHQLKSRLLSTRPHSKASQLLESKMARAMTHLCPQMATSEFEPVCVKMLLRVQERCLQLLFI